MMEKINQLNKIEISTSDTTFSSTPTPSMKEFEIKNKLELKNVFGDNNGAILSLNIVGDDYLILSSCSSNNIQLWTMEGTHVICIKMMKIIYWFVHIFFY